MSTDRYWWISQFASALGKSNNSVCVQNFLIWRLKGRKFYTIWCKVKLYSDLKKENYRECLKSKRDWLKLIEQKLSQLEKGELLKTIIQINRSKRDSNSRQKNLTDFKNTDFIKLFKLIAVLYGTVEYNDAAEIQPKYSIFSKLFFLVFFELD